MMQETNLVLEIKSHLDELPRTRDFVREFCSRNVQRFFGEEDINQLELAVHEAAVNIIRHAYGNRIDQRIVIEAHWFDDKLMFRLNDWGQSFGPRFCASSGIGRYNRNGPWPLYNRPLRGRSHIHQKRNRDEYTLPYKTDKNPENIRS